MKFSTLEYESRFKKIMEKIWILNIYQLNIYNVLNLTFKVKIDQYLMLSVINFTLFRMINLQITVYTVLSNLGFA